jgi:hypothetical protein
MQHRSRDTAASALRTPSVMNSGRVGSPSQIRALGGTSRTIQLPPAVSYLTGFSCLVRGSSGRSW